MYPLEQQEIDAIFHNIDFSFDIMEYCILHDNKYFPIHPSLVRVREVEKLVFNPSFNRWMFFGRLKNNIF